jgi:hypothetical protein
MNSSPFLNNILLLVLGTLVVGCGRVQTQESPFFRREIFMSDPPQTLAIAPFANTSNVEDAGERMRTAVYGALSGLGYQDIELSRVDQAVNQQALRFNVRPEEVAPQDIAIPELADAVVFAEVERVSRMFLLIYARYRIDINLAVYSTRSRQQLYTNEFIVTNRRFSFPTSLIGVGKSLLSTIWFMRGSELEESYDEVAQEIAQRFPAPPGEVGRSGIYIRRVSVDVARETLRVGDRVVVRVEGSPGKAGSFDVGARIAGQPLRESAAGQYTGREVIQQGDDARYAYVKARLEGSGEGAESVEADAHDQAFSIDTLPPVSYAVDTWAELPDRKGIVISFAPEDRTSPQSEDVPVAFHIFRGLQHGENLAYLGTTRETRYTDPDARPGVDYEYAVVAVDGAGNESSVRTKVRITPAP